MGSIEAVGSLLLFIAILWFCSLDGKQTKSRKLSLMSLAQASPENDAGMKYQDKINISDPIWSLGAVFLLYEDAVALILCCSPTPIFNPILGGL